MALRMQPPHQANVCSGSCTFQDSQAYAESNGMFFIETSAKLATNVNLLFEVSMKLGYLYESNAFSSLMTFSRRLKSKAAHCPFSYVSIK